MDLRDTIDLLAASGPRPSASPLPPRALVDAWTAAVPAFYARVQQVYLIEFLIMGQIRIDVAPIGQYAPGVGHYTIDALTIGIGDLAVTLSPRLAPGSDHQGVLLLQAAGEAQQRLELLCDFRGGAACWMAEVREQGLRKLVGRFLPPRLEPLDESRFKQALNDVLIGEQPVFLLDKDGLRARFRDTVDRLTSQRMHAELARAASLRLEQMKKGTLLPKAGPKVPLLEAPEGAASRRSNSASTAWLGRETATRATPPAASPSLRKDGL